ncbi:hypothetical protein DL991_10375 [Amycolatopsis sp. WAC 01375]|uniref:hypothetical protein n=1 Tax=Amycolatopsis sp. WAC 01375 TaxID=2203194 RepID=UPI000F76D97F|nr:hypothetical protein [Amycolatopsis sp. WAC 01375]RSM80516.1 hypothetical protein DL991_10375 [Amycolatopsis sp. WAC 01375]
MPCRDGVMARMPWQRSSVNPRAAQWSTIGEAVIESAGDDAVDADWSGPGENRAVFVRWMPRYERSPDRMWAVLEWRAHKVLVVDIAVLVGVPEAKVWSWLRRHAREARKEREAAALTRRPMSGETT